MCSFYHESLCTSVETNVNKFAISNHTALKLDVQALRSYLRPICEYELYTLPNKKVSAAKDHGKNYMKDRPPLVRHLLRNRLLHMFDDFPVVSNYGKLSAQFHDGSSRLIDIMGFMSFF